MKGFCAVTIFVTARKRDATALSREEFFARNAAGSVDFATRKKFCTECVYRRVQGPHAAQNARISAKRFAATARLPTACGGGARQIWFHFDSRRARRVFVRTRRRQRQAAPLRCRSSS